MILSARYSYKRGLEFEPLSQAPVEDSRLNILFLGTDEKTTASVRADTILLVSIDSKTEAEFYLFEIQGSGSSQGALGLGKRYLCLWWSPLAMEAVSSLLNVPMVLCAQTDGFKNC